MRAVLYFVAAAALLSACSKPQAGAPSPPAAHVSAAASAAALVGAFSLSGGCQADDGIDMKDDGSAWVSGHGEGMWALNHAGDIVFVLREGDLGAEPNPTAPRAAITLSLTAPAGDHLTGTFDDGTRINAKRCPPPDTQGD